MVNLLLPAVAVLSILTPIAGAGQDDCPNQIEDAANVVFLQTAFATESTKSEGKLLSMLEVKAAELMKSRSSSVVLLVLVVVLLFMIPVVVYMLSDGSSMGSGHRLLEGAKGKGEVGPSHPGSSRQLRTPGMAGSQRMSVDAGVLPPTAQHYSPSDGPPVICRELVLPETEARFLIEAASLRSEGARAVTILGGSGRQPLLVAYLQDHGPKGFQLWLHSMGQNSTVLDTPRAVVVPGRSAFSYEIYDRDLKLYGELESSGGRLTLMCNGYPVLVIDETTDELHYNACQMDGRMLATGRLAPDVPQHVLAKLGGEAWRLRVVAGCDAIVVLSTMLTAMLMKGRLRPGSATSSMPPSAKPSIVLG